MLSLTFDELQRKIVQAGKKHFHDGLTHNGFVNTKRVFVTDTRKNPKTTTTTQLSFVGAPKSNTC
jgi:hypothetical protein